MNSGNSLVTFYESMLAIQTPIGRLWGNFIFIVDFMLSNAQFFVIH